MFLLPGRKLKLGSRILLHLPGPVLIGKEHSDLLPEHVDRLGHAVTSVRCDHPVSLSGKSGVKILIGLCLILKTAHESSAHTADLLRIQREVLFLCHTDGHRNKIREIAGAA